MREMVQVVVWFAVVIAVGVGIIWGVDSALGVRHINADGAAAGWAMALLHHLPYMLFGGALVWLYRSIFGR